MSSLGDQVRDWHQGVLAVAREDWDCALCLFSNVREPLAKMSFNMGCVHLMAGDPEAALRVSAPGRRNCGPESLSSRGHRGKGRHPSPLHSHLDGEESFYPDDYLEIVLLINVPS